MFPMASCSLQVVQPACYWLHVERADAHWAACLAWWLGGFSCLFAATQSLFVASPVESASCGKEQMTLHVLLQLPRLC